MLQITATAASYATILAGIDTLNHPNEPVDSTFGQEYHLSDDLMKNIRAYVPYLSMELQAV